VFSTCYAAAFGVPGVVGPGRVVTFATDSGSLAYERVSWQHSYLFEYLVVQALLQGQAPWSVEDAFSYARDRLSRDAPSQVPLQDDETRAGFPLAPGAPRPPAPTPPPPPPAPARPTGGQRESFGGNLCAWLVSYGDC
jgi:hypothetical protein